MDEYENFLQRAARKLLIENVEPMLSEARRALKRGPPAGSAHRSAHENATKHHNKPLAL